MKYDEMVALRTRAAVDAGVDLGNPIPPAAAALADDMLHSRCAACFARLPEHAWPCCGACGGSIAYCTKLCLDSDARVHVASGECHLLGLLSCPRGSCDVRAALRFLLSISNKETTGTGNRVAGLLSNRDKIVRDVQLGRQVEEAAHLARHVISQAQGPAAGEVVSGVLLQDIICVVITNGVQLELDEAGPPPVRVCVGTAVYGSAFSWLNHSCRPNACYRFVPPPRGHSHRHPWVVVRSLERIAAAQDVTIAYTDLLQPKHRRRCQLENKYRFLCRCRRCEEEPFAYSDVALETVGRCKTDGCSGCLVPSGYFPSTEPLLRAACCSQCSHRYDVSELALDEPLRLASEAFLCHDDPVKCCTLLESALFKLLMRHDQAPEILINSACLDSFFALKSAYRVLAVGEGGDEFLEAAAGLSVLVAGIVQHIYNAGEHGLAMTLGWLWMDAGTALMDWDYSAATHQMGSLLRCILELISGSSTISCAAICFGLSGKFWSLSLGADHPLTRYALGQLAITGG